ncbi:hypothetical protein ABEV73_07415 [Geobacillus stearothermophilus]|uniref:hypothetical protein n=1 Tax=Geobacillus stearothermophilus TaxID=1422 RepID=UPI003D1D7B13
MAIKRSLWLKLSTIQLIILFYLAAVAVSTVLLWLPIVHQPGRHHFVFMARPRPSGER